MNLTIEAEATLDFLKNKFPNDLEILSMYIPFHYQNQKWPDLLLVYGDIYRLDPQNVPPSGNTPNNLRII